MGFILEDRMQDGIQANGWFAGQNKKYSDMFNLTADKGCAEVFDDENKARIMAELLNRDGWNFFCFAKLMGIWTRGTYEIRNEKRSFMRRYWRNNLRWRHCEY